MNGSMVKWIAFLSGLIGGMILGGYLWITTDRGPGIVGWLAVLSAFGCWWVTTVVVRWHRRVQPDASQESVIIENCYVWGWKERMVRHIFIVDKQNPSNNERRVYHLENWHWSKPVYDSWFYAVTAAVLFWGGLKFPGHDTMIEGFLSIMRPDDSSWQELAKPLCVIALVFGLGWLAYRTRFWESLTRRYTGPILVVLTALWGLTGFPGADWLQEEFDSGSSRPWFLASLVVFAVAVLKWTDFVFGFAMAAQHRVVRGRLPLPFLPSRISPLNVANIVGADYVETAAGKALGYGSVLVKEQGEKERKYHEFGPLAHFKEFADAVNRVTTRRYSP